MGIATSEVKTFRFFLFAFSDGPALVVLEWIQPGIIITFIHNITLNMNFNFDADFPKKTFLKPVCMVRCSKS